MSEYVTESAARGADKVTDFYEFVKPSCVTTWLRYRGAVVHDSIVLSCCDVRLNNKWEHHAYFL